MSKPHTKLTKQQIQQLPIKGNAHDDMHIFRRAHVYATDESNSVQDRAELLAWVETEVMGCESSLLTMTPDAFLKAYLMDY